MIEGRSLSEIRTALLALWSTGMTSIGKVLDQAPGSWAYELCDSLAVDVLRIEGSAEALGLEIFPSTASVATLERQATIQGQTRDEGTPWQGTVTVTGTNGTYSVLGRTLIRSGFVYRPSVSGDEITLSGGEATFAVVADREGPDSILSVGRTLTWNSAPAGLSPLATVATSAVDSGADEETTASFAERVESYRRARPAGGNPAHLVELAIAHTRVSVAYVYPTLAPDPGGYSNSLLDTPGCVTIIVAGAAQGTGAVNTRLLTNDQLIAVQAYFDGTKDANEATIAGSRLYSAQLNVADFKCENATYLGSDVDITITNDASVYPLPWTGSYPVGSGTTTTLVIAGDRTALAGERTAIGLASGSSVRGNLVVATLPAAVFDGFDTTFTFSPALPGTPQGFIDPAPENLGAYDYDTGTVGAVAGTIVRALFDYWDGLGPGDVPAVGAGAPATPSIARRRRFPPESWSGNSVVDPSSVIAAAMDANGVTDCACTTPSGLVFISPKSWPLLDQIRVRFA